MADPILNGTTLPCPQQYEEDVLLRAADQEMSDGSLVRDIVDAATKRRYYLRWENLTATEKGNVTTAWTTTFVADAQVGVAYTDLDAQGHTVTVDSDNPAVKFTRVKSPLVRYSAEIRLRDI